MATRKWINVIRDCAQSKQYTYKCMCTHSYEYNGKLGEHNLQ